MRHEHHKHTTIAVRAAKCTHFFSHPRIFAGVLSTPTAYLENERQEREPASLSSPQ